MARVSKTLVDPDQESTKASVISDFIDHILFADVAKAASDTELLDDHRVLEPPDPFPNSVVKRHIADGSVGSPHVRVGHRQASI